MEGRYPHDGFTHARERAGSCGRCPVREPIPGQHARAPLRPRGRQDARGRHREGPEQSDPGVGRVRGRPQGRALRDRNGHGLTLRTKFWAN